MIRTTRNVCECVCDNCGIIHLLGQTFNGQRCCDRPKTRITGERTIVEYKKTIEEEKQEVDDQLLRNP